MSVPRLTSLTCQRHQAQRAQVCLGVENAGETSLVATGVYQAPPLGSVSKGQVNPVGQSGRLFFIKWKYFIETFNSVQVFPSNCLPPLPLYCRLYLSNGRLQEGQLTPGAAVDIGSRARTEIFSVRKE